MVRHGFATSFHFKLDRQSRTCQGPDGGDHATRPESHEALCQIRGGDGFAFVIQDAGHTALDIMLGGELTDLMRVRRYLDAERGGW